MDVLNEQVIDLGLNVIGYLAAAGLGMLLHSAVVQRRRRATTGEPRLKVAEPSEVAARQTVPSVQFVDLRRRSEEAIKPQPGNEGSDRAAKGDGRRDRAEIIRLARQMLSAGAPGETVRRTLPISEGELAFLQSANSK